MASSTRHQPRRHLGVAQHLRVGEVLDLGDLGVVHRLGMREVEAQPVGRDQRALLRDVIAQHLAQRLVQQMGGGVVGADMRAARVIDIEFQRRSGAERAFLDGDAMGEHVARHLLRVGDAHPHAVRMHDAGVADLSAGLAIERRLVEHHESALAFVQPLDLAAVADQCLHHAFRILGLVAEEVGRADLVAQRKPERVGLRFARARPRGARELALPRHRGVEGGGVDADAARLERVLGEVEREAVGVVKRERGVARKLPAARDLSFPRRGLRARVQVFCESAVSSSRSVSVISASARISSG